MSNIYADTASEMSSCTHPVTLGFSQSELVHSLAVLLSNYCRYFGRTFTHTVVIVLQMLS